MTVASAIHGVTPDPHGGLRAQLARRLATVADAQGRRLRLPAPRPGETVVVVGRIADDEPLLRGDEAAARRAPTALLRGLGVLSLLADSRRVLLAVRDDHVELLETFRQLTAESAIEVVALPARYPLDDRSLLADLAELTQRRPASFATARVFGASTLVSVGEALDGRPQLERAVSIVGAVARPQTRFLPLGCRVEDAVTIAGGATTRAWVAYENGIVAGRRVLGEDVVDLATRGLVIVPADHARAIDETVPLADRLRQAASVCQQCRLCTEGCPAWLSGAELEPHRLLRLLGQSFLADAAPRTDDPLAVAALQCTGCRACTLRCPAAVDSARLVGGLAERLRAEGVALSAPPELAPRPERATRRLDQTRLLAQLRPLSLEPPPLSTQSVSVERLALPLRDPLGQPRVALAGTGDEVRRGALLLRAGSADVADIYAPRSGVVEGIDPDAGLILRCL